MLLETVVAGVHLLDLQLLFIAVGVLDDALQIPVGVANNAPIPCRIVQHGRRQRYG